MQSPKFNKFFFFIFFFFTFSLFLSSYHSIKLKLNLRLLNIMIEFMSTKDGRMNPMIGMNITNSMQTQLRISEHLSGTSTWNSVYLRKMCAHCARLSFSHSLTHPLSLPNSLSLSSSIATFIHPSSFKCPWNVFCSIKPRNRFMA